MSDYAQYRNRLRKQYLSLSRKLEHSNAKGEDVTQIEKKLDVLTAQLEGSHLTKKKRVTPPVASPSAP